MNHRDNREEGNMREFHKNNLTGPVNMESQSRRISSQSSEFNAHSKFFVSLEG